MHNILKLKPESVFINMSIPGLLFLLLSCSAKKNIIPTQVRQNELIEVPKKEVSFCENCFSSWLIMDAKSGIVLDSHNFENFYIPASTMKILTLYVAMKEAKRNIPSIKYSENDSLLIFKGLGDPTLLHPDFEHQPLFNFLSSKKTKKLILDCTGFDHPKYGKGWMWDDFSYNFQPEISPLPINGNTVSFYKEDNEIKAFPDFFQNNITYSKNGKSKRSELLNQFIIPESFWETLIDIPFIQSCGLTAQLLSDALGISVTPAENNSGTLSNPVLLDGAETDTVLRRIMYQSDNLFSEQLLLSLYGNNQDTFSLGDALQYFYNKYFDPLNAKMKWVDASGLSRYNLITAKTLVLILFDLYRKFPEEVLFPLIAISGKNSSSVHNDIPEETVIIAKSGSMTGVYNLAGFIITPSGRRLVFAIMNNNFHQPVTSVRSRVWDYLGELGKKY